MRDEPAYRYIDADVVVQRVAVERRSFGVEQFNTDSVALPVLLPAGQYTATPMTIRKARHDDNSAGARIVNARGVARGPCGDGR